MGARGSTAGADREASTPQPPCNVHVWRGDITKLHTEAIVNAANESGLGCDIPGHCIDSAIHQAAGPDLRRECLGLGGVPTGTAKLTRGYQLPARYIVHVTGPQAAAGLPVDAYDFDLLGRCYTACLEVARQHGLRELAFCCLSTGLFGYPKQPSARAAMATVRDWLRSPAGAQARLRRVVFVVYTDEDEAIYRSLWPSVWA